MGGHVGAHVRQRHRGAPRVLRGAPNAAGYGGPCRGACQTAASRGAPGPPGRLERWGVWGAISGPPMYLDRGVFDSIADGPPVAPLEPEPVVAVRAEAQEVGRTRHGGKAIAAEHLDGPGSLVGGEIELDGLRARRAGGDGQQRLVAPRPQVSRRRLAAGPGELDRAAG